MIRRLRDFNDMMAALAEARRSQGLLQAEVAERCGHDQRQVSEWLNGKRGMQAHTAFELVGALGFDLALVIRDEPESEASSYDEDPCTLDHDDSDSVCFCNERPSCRIPEWERALINGEGA